MATTKRNTATLINDSIRAEFPDVYWHAGLGFCGPDWQFAQASYYGRLAAVAMNFYIQCGNPAELDAAYFYTRYAVRAAEGVR